MKSKLKSILAFTSVSVNVLMLAATTAAGDAAAVAPRPLASAFEAMEDDNWEWADSIARRDGKVAAALIEWHRLRMGLGEPGDILEFLSEYGHWPGLSRLRRMSEEAIANADNEDVLDFYEDYTPQTGSGALSLAQALKMAGRQNEARQVAATAWKNLDLSIEEHERFISAWEKELKPHHKTRLDNGLWRGFQDLEKMLPLVNGKKRDIARARILIERNSKNADAFTSSLPKAAMKDPHVAYALYRRHIRNGERNQAIKIVLAQSRIQGGLGEPERWARWRRELTRMEMRDKNHRIAYDLASVHKLRDGGHFADLEWLSGYLSLRYLKSPNKAMKHFRKLRKSVRTPISLGRAEYWIGRTYEYRNNKEAALLSYKRGASHVSSFYGLLSAEKANLDFKSALAASKARSHWRETEFARGDVFEASVLALASGRPHLASQFIMHLSESLNQESLIQLADAMSEIGTPHLQVRLAKETAKRGVVVPDAYFPLHPLQNEKLLVPDELALSVARRESEFNPVATSGAGAMGLMQLLPGTAKDMAKHLKIEYDKSRLLEDWRYNALLGSGYLSKMAERFDGNLVLISTAYNAGPKKTGQWLEILGDPRDGSNDIVDWIEHIPYGETRNYVMRVAESVVNYRMRLGTQHGAVSFTDELAGKTFKVSR